MGKSFKGFSKALSLILAVAMVVTCVPTSAYAADLLAGESEDLLISNDNVAEETSDALIDASASEENSSTSIDTQTASAPSDDADENTAGEEEFGPDQVKDDITISFDAATTKLVDTGDAALNNPLKADIYAYIDSAKATKLNAANQSANKNVATDSEKDYVIMVEPNAGFAFDLSNSKTIITSASYKDYSTDDSGLAKTLDVSTFTIADPTATEAGYNKGTKKVTIPSTELAKVLAGKKAGKADSGILTLAFANPATAAKWNIAGFDLKDITEKASYLPSKKEMTNGTNYNLVLSDVLEVGSLDVSAFDVQVVVFDENNEEKIKSNVLDNTAIDVVAGDAMSTWKTATGGAKFWAKYNAGTLTIGGAAITTCYNNNYSIVVDVTAKTIGGVKIKTNTASKSVANFAVATDGTGGYTAATDQTGDIDASDAGASAVQGKDFYFIASKKAPYAHIHSVTYTVDGKSDDDYKCAIDELTNTYKIPKEHIAKGNVEVTVKGAYALTKLGGGTNYRVLDIDGKVITQAEADEPLTFQIAPEVGKKTTSVSYTIDGGDSQSATLNADGTFTISKVTGAVEVNPTITSASDGTSIIKLADTYAALNVRKLDKDSTQIVKGGVPTTTGEPVLFTITPTGAIVEKVSYSMGSAKDVVLTPVYGSTYKTPAVTGDITLNIVYQATARVYAPANKNVTVNFAEPGKYADVPEGSFSFTVTPKAGVKVTKISYNTTDLKTDGTALAGTTGGTFTVTAGSTYYLFVTTEETVDPTTFKAVFNSAKLEKTYEAGKPKTDLYITDQVLKIVMGDGPQTVTAAFRPVKDGKIRTAVATTNTITAPETTDILTLAKTGTLKIAPKKVGNQDVVFTGKIADGVYGNNLVYNGTLKVSVANPYTDLKISGVDTIYTDAGDASQNLNNDDQHIAKLKIEGKDGQTGVYGEISVSGQVTSVAWSFVPSLDTVPAADRKYAFVDQTTPKVVTDVSSKAGVSNLSKAWVASSEAGAVTVNAIVTFKDGSEEKLTKTLNFIAPNTDTYFMTRKITGAVDKFDLLKDASTPAAYGNGTAIILGLNVTDKKEISVKYDMYKVVKDGLASTAYDTEAEIATLLTKGDIVKVENAVIGDAALQTLKVSDDTEDKTDTNKYAEFGTKDGAYTISALKATDAAHYLSLKAPDVTIDGVKIPELNFANRPVTVKVVNTVTRHKFELFTIDDQSKNSSGTNVYLVETLSDSYINGRDFSKVEATLGGEKKQIGIEFNSIADKASFKLPTESDFSTKPYNKKILLGWAECTYATGAIAASGGVATSVLEPGSYVTVTADTAYKAIWADKYVTYTNTDGVIAGAPGGTLVKLYDATKSFVNADNKVIYWATVPASLEKGYDIPTVVGVGRVKGIKNASAVYNTTSGVVLTQLNVEEEIYDDGFTLTGADADSTYDLNAEKLTARHIAPSDVAGTSGNANVKVAWTDSGRTDVTDVYEATITMGMTTNSTNSIAWAGTFAGKISSDKAKMIEGGVPASLEGALTEAGTAIALESATYTGGVAGHERYYNYTYRWTSSDTTVATVEGGKKVDQYKATINPVKAGKTNIKLEVLKSGKVIADKTFELTVEASDVQLVFADNEGHTGITEVLAHAGNKNLNVFKAKAVTKSGAAVTGGTFSFGAVSDYATNKVIDGNNTNGQTQTWTLAGDSDGYTNIPVVTKDFVGTDKLHVQFSVTVSGVPHTYQKDIDVKTYYSVNLKPATDTFITKDGVKQLAADGTTAKTVEIKLTEDDMKDVKETAWSKGSAAGLNKKDFNFKGISLAGYSAVYKDETQSFSNWVVDKAGPGATMTKTNPSVAATKYDENATIATLIGYKDDGTDHVVDDGAKAQSNFESGKGYYTLVPTMAKTVTLTGVPGEIAMNYSATVANEKAVTISVEPTNLGEVLDVKGTQTGFYGVWDVTGKTNANQTTDVGTSGKASFVIKAFDTYNVGFSPATKTTWKAGSDVLSIYAHNSGKAIATINLYVNGLNYDSSTKKVQFFENGQIVKSDYRTFNGNTYYFDAEGNWIETTGITKINGKDVMIVNGVVAPKGKNVFEGNTYYVGDNGVIQTGWLTSDGAAATAANGVYYADPAHAGKLVTGVQTIDGKKFVFGPDNKVSRASSAAKDYEKINGYYVNAAGEIAENGLFKVDNINRLFRADGSIVAYGDPDVTDGKIKVGNITYVIDKITNEAKPDKKMVNAKFNWTTKKPAKFDKKSSLPTSDWEIKYNLEGETTEQKVTGTVTAVADPADYATNLDVKKVTFTFTASESDLAGYFSDSKGEKALTATPAVWTYTFSGSSDIGTGGGIEIQGFEEGQEFKFTGSAIKPAVEVWDNDLGVKLTLGVDYSLSYKNNTKITTDASKTPVVTVNGKGNYVGKTVTRTFKIVDPREGATDLTATVKKIELGFGSASPVYNGEPWYPESITVDGNAFQHSSGEDYTTDSTANYVFSFSNNTDAGTATVGVTGQDGKTKKKTFKINKVDLSKVPTANLEISPADADWTVKGAVPTTTVTYTPEGGSAITLVEGQDYTLKVNYADKKKNVADGNTVTITGKGTNFAKKATSTETFKIEAYALSNANILEVVAPAGAKVKAVKATVVDGNGVKINKKDYTVNVYDSEDTVLAPTATLTAGSTYKVEVVAPTSGNITGSGSFEFIAAADMSKAKVTLSKDLKKNGVAYTGEPIDVTAVQSGELIRNLFDSEITVEYKNPTTKKYEKLTYGEDFEVLGYQNNVKKGNMTVYIRAKEDSTKVSGVKYFKIKISAKTMKKAD